MIIIPIGHEDTTVRRQPYISYTIIVLNLIIYFFFTHTIFSDSTIQQQLYEILEYSMSHPHAELPEEFTTLLGQDFINYYASQREQFLDESESPMDFEIEDSQSQLETMVADFMSRLGEDTYRKWGYIPSREGHMITLITNFFLHAGLFHLFSNLFLFYLTGPFVEDRWGRLIFILFYFAGGVIGSLTFGAFTDTPDIPLVGASSAIAGVMGAFLVLFVKTKIRFLYIFLLIHSGTFEVPAYTVLPLWFLLQLANALTASNSAVAFWAHVGGFILGLLFAGIMKWAKIEEHYISPRIDEEITLFQAHPQYEEAIEQLNQGNHHRAVKLLRSALNEAPQDIAILETLVNTYLTLSIEEPRYEQEIQRFGSKLIGQSLREGQPEQSYDYYLSIKESYKTVKLNPQILYNLASRLYDIAGANVVFKLYKEIITNNPKHMLALKALLSIADNNMNVRHNFKEAFSSYVMVKHHPQATPQFIGTAEEGIKKCLSMGGSQLAGVKEEDVKGLKLYQEQPLQAKQSEQAGPLLMSLEINRSRLKLINALSVMIEDGKSRQLVLYWNRIICLAITLAWVTPSDPSQKSKKTIIFDIVHKVDHHSMPVQVHITRLFSYELPLKKLFKNTDSPTKAYKSVISFFLKNVQCPVLPDRDSLLQFTFTSFKTEKDLNVWLENQLQKILT